MDFKEKIEPEKNKDGEELQEHWLEPPKTKQRPGFLAGIGIGVLLSAVVVVAVGGIGFGLLRFWQQDVEDAAGQGQETDAVQEGQEDTLLNDAVVAKLTLLYDSLKQEYYEDLDDGQLVEGLYKGMFEATEDPYTEYYTEEEYTQLQQKTTGTYYGIGAVLSQDKDTKEIMIVSVYDGSPAQKAGLQAGDIVNYVDEYKAADQDVSDLVTHIQGEKGTTVHIKVTRESEDLEFDVKRAEVEIPSVAGEMVDDTTAYVQISTFSSVTYEQFVQVMKKLDAEGMQAVVFDVRGNAGGVITAVTDILDYILPEGLTVYTEEKDGTRTEYTSDEAHKIDIPVAVLIDSNSASASEIFAGAIQDYDYGTIIGTKSYGKGIVQTIVPLTDGSAMKYTTAKYFTPDGHYIHDVGITPDIELEYKYTGSEDVFEFSGDNQIVRALEVLEGTE